MATRPREPKGPETQYVSQLLKVWRSAQDTASRALLPLLVIWPTDEPLERLDEYSPFTPTRPPRMRDLSDSDLRRLWPSLNPNDVRQYAPWATSHDQVRRLMSGNNPNPIENELQDYVNRGIQTERARSPQGVPDIDNVINTARRRIPLRRFAEAADRAPIILGPDGLPISQPPVPSTVTQQTIERQLEHVRFALGQQMTEEYLSPIIRPNGEAVDRHVARDLARILRIDIRRAVPGISPLIDEWTSLNVELVQRAQLVLPDDRPGRHNSLFGDLLDTITRAWDAGTRVEVLAAELQDRYGVSDSRAMLIARDQTLKLNGQINHYRQVDAGVSQYKWGTSRNRRVRKSHRKLDRTIQSWNSPPKVAPGRYEHPGGDFQCRCVAIPILDD